MHVKYKKFKEEIPKLQGDALNVDAYFFREQGKEESILSHFQQELRKKEGYAILEIIRDKEFKTITKNINQLTEVSQIANIIRQHEAEHGKNSVLFATIKIDHIAEEIKDKIKRDLSPEEIKELKITHLAAEIRNYVRLNRKDPETFFKKAKSMNDEPLFSRVFLSPFIETESKTARQISDEYVMQKKHFRNGYAPDKNTYVLGWEYTTEFVDKKISEYTVASNIANDACNRFFQQSTGANMSRFERNPATRKIFEQADENFQRLNKYKKLKTAIVQFREHGGDFTESELKLKPEMLAEFFKENKAEILAETKAKYDGIKQAFKGKSDKTPIEIKNVLPPEIFLPVIPIVECINRLSKHFDLGIEIYDSGQKGYSSMSRKVKQELYNGSACLIGDGVRNTIAYRDEESYRLVSNAFSKYLDKMGIMNTSEEEVVASGYFSRKYQVPIFLDKKIEFPSTNDSVNITATRIAEIKFIRQVDLALKKETDFLYQTFRELNPEGTDNKRILLQTNFDPNKPEVTAIDIKNNIQTAQQVFEDMFNGLNARPGLMKKIEKLKEENKFNFPLHLNKHEIAKVVADKRDFSILAEKLQEAEKLLNRQNLLEAPLSTQKAFYKALKGSDLKPESFFDKKSLEALQEEFKKQKLERNITRSCG